MWREVAEFGVRARHLPATDSESRQPASVEQARLRSGLDLVRGAGVRIDDRPRNGQVCVDGFPRDEQVHDLGRALEDAVDPQVTHYLLDRNRPLAARPL